MFIGDTLYAAGPVTATRNTGGVFQVGDTFFVGVNDNGPAMDKFIEGGVPAALGPLTIQEIIAIIGPAPSGIFRQGISGNLIIH